MFTLLTALVLSPSATIDEKYKLVFSDEFNVPGRPDPKKWNFEEGFVRNKELQWYRSSNAEVKGGNLVIEARKEAVKNPAFVAGSDDWKKSRAESEFTSACVTTKDRFNWKYGRLEVRAKISAKNGLWPAIWTLGTARPWPGCGEVDVLEYYQHTILANTAYGENGAIWNSGKTNYDVFRVLDPSWDSKFHVWRMDWDEHWLKLYVDDRLENATNISHTVQKDGSNPFQEPHYLLLNLAIGSTGGDTSKTAFPSDYLIDYVRIYQRPSDIVSKS